jgi:hypothetical protein
LPGKQTKNKRRGLSVLYIYALIMLFALLTVATYTWFSLSKTPRVSDLAIHITSAHGLELASKHDAEAWTRQLDFLGLVDETAPLRPATWSDKEQRFFAATYGIDGRLTDHWDPLSDETNANRNNAHGYYTKITFFARTGQSVTATLSPAVAVEEGLQGAGTYVIGTPVWNADAIRHDNGGSGAECAVRVGFRITKLNPDGSPKDSDPTFIIYEPNGDSHLDGTTGFLTTPSIDGTDHLVAEDRLILQSTSVWEEVDPVQRETLIHKLGEFTTPNQLFSLDPEEIAQIDLYLWLEGQDADCTNQISAAKILANIQFGSQSGGQSGLETIN